MMDKFLAKQELAVNKKIVKFLEATQPELKAKLGTIACGENPEWVHQSIEVVTPSGDLAHFHRCRQVWQIGTGNTSRPSIDVDVAGGIPAGAAFVSYCVNAKFV